MVLSSNKVTIVELDNMQLHFSKMFHTTHSAVWPWHSSTKKWSSVLLLLNWAGLTDLLATVEFANSESRSEEAIFSALIFWDVPRQTLPVWCVRCPLITFFIKIYLLAWEKLKWNAEATYWFSMWPSQLSTAFNYPRTDTRHVSEEASRWFQPPDI